MCSQFQWLPGHFSPPIQPGTRLITSTQIVETSTISKDQEQPSSPTGGERRAKKIFITKKATGGNQAQTFWPTADCFIFSQCGYKQPANMTLRVSTHTTITEPGILLQKTSRVSTHNHRKPKSQVSTKTSLKSEVNSLRANKNNPHHIKKTSRSYSVPVYTCSSANTSRVLISVEDTE